MEQKEKIQQLAEYLKVEPDEIEVEKFINAWYEMDVYVYDEDHYLILNSSETYYNYDMYGCDNFTEIILEDYNIYEM